MNLYSSIYYLNDIYMGLLILNEPKPVLSTLQSRCFGEIDPETIPAPLVAAGHLGTRMAKLFLDVALFDLDR